MNNFNKASLAGYITKAPVEVMPPQGATYAIECELTIERPNTDRPSVVSFIATDANALILQGAHKGDFILVPEARLVTTNYQRKQDVTCFSCYHVHEYTMASEKLEVIADGKIELIQTPYRNHMGMNRVTLLGNICSDTKENFFQGQSGHANLQIKVAVDRPTWNLQEGDQKADYIFLVLYGRSASFVHDYMNRGDLAMVEGYLTERNIKMNKVAKCPHCGNGSEQTVPNVVREVVVNEIIQFARSYQTDNWSEIEQDYKQFQQDFVEYKDPDAKNDKQEDDVDSEWIEF